MSQDQQSHPLHGLGLKAMLTELVLHYDWPILFEQIPVNCFRSKPSVNSSVKFLHKTTWARERLEAFYLYKFKQLPLPSDEQHALSPRNRTIDTELMSDSPAEIELGDREFFDDPASGPVFPSRAEVQRTSRPKAKKEKSVDQQQAEISSIEKDVSDVVQKTANTDDISTDATEEKVVSPSKPKKTSAETKTSSGGAAPDPWAKWK